MDRVEGAAQHPEPLDAHTAGDSTSAGAATFAVTKLSSSTESFRHLASYHLPVNEPAHVPAHVLVRVWLPDRPGALGLVASRIGAVEGDIVGIDVLEHGDGVAVDEFAVELRDRNALDLLVREIEEVDGASVEEVRIVEHFPDPRLDALESASRLCDAPTIDRAARDAGRRDAAPSSSPTGARCSAPARCSRPPARPSPIRACSRPSTRAPRPRRGSPTAPPVPTTSRWRGSPTNDATLLVGRDGHPFRRRERAQLVALAGIADRTWSILQG